MHELLKHLIIRCVKLLEGGDGLAQGGLGLLSLRVVALLRKGERHLASATSFALAVGSHLANDLWVGVQASEVGEQREQRRRLHAHEILKAHEQELLPLKDAQRAGDADRVERVGDVLHGHAFEALLHIAKELGVGQRAQQVGPMEERRVALHKLGHLLPRARRKRRRLVPSPRGEHGEFREGAHDGVPHQYDEAELARVARRCVDVA
mmetsp:Transcript_34560/g.90940  ORF Transcript_34560/g.90940 Transcript_34560/m.90940 type:complete len:208 (-) Transcript_34560:849-1472(-)